MSLFSVVEQEELNPADGFKQEDFTCQKGHWSQ
jgi:hypothetical protein